MRIVHVANAYTPRSGGIRTTVHALGHGYRSAGHEFVLLVPGPRARDEELPWGRRVTIPGPVVPGCGGYRVLANLNRVRAELDALEPDRLEVSDRLTLRGLGPWARAAGVASIVIAHERLDGVIRAFTPLSARSARWAADRHNATTAERFDRVVTTTAFAAQEFARIGVSTNHAPLGVDLAQFRPATRTRTVDVPLIQGPPLRVSDGHGPGRPRALVRRVHQPDPGMRREIAIDARKIELERTPGSPS